MKKILVIPDIHGSDFWKDSCADISGYDKVIFLGDYVDSSVFENVSNEAMLNNFKQIIEFKRSNPDKVILLYGNHDFGYRYINYMASRFRISLIAPIRRLLRRHKLWFEMAHIEDDKFLFTHAGVTDTWYRRHKTQLDKFPGTLDQQLNEAFRHRYYRMFGEISAYRGGRDKSGSPLWADIHETANGDCLPGFIHVVGHTPVDEVCFAEFDHAAIIFAIVTNLMFWRFELKYDGPF